MSRGTHKVLLIGFGNPGRLDDGLGPALAALAEGLNLPGVTVESDYQLCLEDAEAVARHDVAIFADADVSGPEPFSFGRLEPAPSMSFSTHSLRPAAVLGLARQIFGAETEGYILSIRGYVFNEYEESLSERARANLGEAAAFIERVCRTGFSEPEAFPSPKRKRGNKQAPSASAGLDRTVTAERNRGTWRRSHLRQTSEVEP